MLGLIALPLVFVWMLFLPGYSRSLRLAVFAYGLGPVIAALALLAISVIVASAVRLMKI